MTSTGKKADASTQMIKYCAKTKTKDLVIMDLGNRDSWEREEMGTIEDYSLDFIREPLKTPFGFKGGYLDELWQVVCKVRLDNGCTGMGVGVQSVLWSDSETFSGNSQAGGNTLMLSVTEYALKLLKGKTFTNPVALQKEIEDQVYEYARIITGNVILPRTFALNAMVAVDFALWQIYAQSMEIKSMDELCEKFCPVLSKHQLELGEIPLVTYKLTMEEIECLLKDGAFILKIKIGSNPNNDNDMQAMCQWDVSRLQKIHEIASKYQTPHTTCGHPVYYLDANGRYPDKELLQQFLEGARACGAIQRIVLLEEPFAETNLQDAADIPVRVAADESAHCAGDVVELIDKYHYGAIALKPIAKTLSATFEIYKAAHKRGIPCFCADLTVPPVMLEWNMQVAARLPAIPGIKIGIVESNGPQNYQNWEKLLYMHPEPHASFLRPDRHMFRLGQHFYEKDLLLAKMPEYEKILENGR